MSAFMLDRTGALVLERNSTLARNIRQCGRMPWAVVRTHPQAERWAAQNLNRIGYDVYLPLVRVRRRDPVLRTLIHNVLMPLFGRYLFIRLGDDPWTPVRYAPGVHSLLMNDQGQPQMALEADIARLQATEDIRQEITPESSEWASGAACRLRCGPFQGEDAVVLTVGRREAKLAMVIFGALRQIVAPISSLEAR